MNKKLSAKRKDWYVVIGFMIFCAFFILSIIIFENIDKELEEFCASKGLSYEKGFNDRFCVSANYKDLDPDFLLSKTMFKIHSINGELVIFQ